MYLHNCWRRCVWEVRLSSPAVGWLGGCACPWLGFAETRYLKPFWAAGLVAHKLDTLIFFDCWQWLLVFFPSFQNNASKLLLAIMESRHDSENAERILYNMRPKELVSAWVAPKPLTPFKPVTAALWRLGGPHPPQRCCKRSVHGSLPTGRHFKDFIEGMRLPGSWAVQAVGKPCRMLWTRRSASCRRQGRSIIWCFGIHTRKLFAQESEKQNFLVT